MAVASLFKAVGPMGGTALFAWSLTNGKQAPLDVHFSFTIMCFFAMTSAVYAHLRLPNALNEPVHEPERTNREDDSRQTNVKTALANVHAHKHHSHSTASV